ncbi:GM13701 [Drosophila sechellia]|uniref:GM13701 n=1 Tax=Drosophila sechellia TaxID=7238 RepID=B4IJT3_DROSE|nr:GM13701 [Drosophila sechellia]
MASQQQGFKGKHPNSCSCSCSSSSSNTMTKNRTYGQRDSGHWALDTEIGNGFWLIRDAPHTTTKNA